jgi:hypothetical protein
MLSGPVLLPVEWGMYLFGSVWLGFIFLVDPLNDRKGLPSIWHDLRHGYPQRLKALLASGAVCGILWEFWNYWASAKWFYIFPILREWTLFEMPLPGFLGFPLFAVEMFALYILAAEVLDDLSTRFDSAVPDPPTSRGYNSLRTTICLT